VADHYRRTVEEFGHDLVVRDLYRMGFDPVLKSLERPTHPDFTLYEDVAAELAAISGTDVFVLVYPIWFGTPPAMMKGYVDRVLGAGFSHRAVESRQFHPIMSGKHLLSFTTSGASWAWLNEKAAWHALRQVFDHYLANAFSLASVEHVHFSSIVGGLKERFVREHLLQVEETAREICSKLLKGTHI
jgi:NAD(P)H dehydrogenase (quinone)